MLIVAAMTAIAARFPSRRRQQVRLDAFRRLLRKCSADTERLIVRVCKDGHQAQRKVR